MLDYQQTFDTVARALIAQGAPARSGYACCYRTPGGLKCAIGHLIPDEAYDKSFESHAVMSANSSFMSPSIKEKALAIIEAAGGGIEDVGFLSTLQNAHDQSSGNDASTWREFWRSRMLAIAAQYGLDASVLDTQKETA